MKKIALFPFRDDLMCFIHVLLNALDMKDRGHEVTIVMEGASVTLLPKLAQPDNPMHSLFNEVRDKGLIEGACRACSSKLKAAADIEQLGIPLIGDMSNHPGMAAYIERGFEIITF